MKVIVYTNETGGVTVCYPSGELPIDEVKAKDTPEHSIIIDYDDLPNHANDFFDAWELSNDGKVVVNLERAKERAKVVLRDQRGPLLLEQDIAFQRALESGADTSAIVAEKKRLRDITKLADDCTTLDELRAITVS